MNWGELCQILGPAVVALGVHCPVVVAPCPVVVVVGVPYPVHVALGPVVAGDGVWSPEVSAGVL